MTAIIDSTWSQATIRKLYDVAGLRHICIVDVIVVHNDVSSIQNVLRRVVEEHARRGWLFVTACKRSLRRLCFYTCLPVILFTGGLYPSMHYKWYPNMPCRSGVVSQHTLQVGGGGIPACLAGRGWWYPSMPCRSSGPHLGGSCGVWPGGVSSFQAHT